MLKGDAAHEVVAGPLYRAVWRIDAPRLVTRAVRYQHAKYMNINPVWNLPDVLTSIVLAT